MTFAWLLFDWGDTLMYEAGPQDRPMADWSQVRAVEGAVEVLTELSARWPLAVATNATISDHAAIRRALGRAGLDELVREIFCRRDLGLVKSDPRFWEAVAARLAVPPAQLFMVGDDLENDVLAPRRAGLTAVWLNWKRAPLPANLALPALDGIGAPPAIERLDQLPPLLAALART
jgi:putative hydrolase of the HAD superfamily